jgi:asparagine synthase (glutamine-hydrolysing)
MGACLLPQRLADKVKHVGGLGGRPWLAADAGHASAWRTAHDALGLSAPRDLAALCRSMVAASSLPTLLHFEDRNSMAHSIEARVPFLDHPLVEFSLALGHRHKMVGGDTKRVLRKAMNGLLPDKVAQRRDKLGFATPEQSWFRGPLRAPLSAAIDDAIALYPDLFDAAETRKRVNAILDGRRKFDFMPWRIANLGIWGRRFSLTM